MNAEHFRPLLPLVALFIGQAAGAQAQTITLRLAAPEPLLIGSKVQRPLLERRFTLRGDGANWEALAPQLRHVYARIEARQPREVRFGLQGGRWTARAQTGWKVDRATTEARLRGALKRGQAEVQVALRLQAPVRSVRWAQAQGLRHLASGQTGFVGSPDFRVQNIRVGSARVHGTWVQAGQSFDFNARVGRLTRANGFAPGYVITGETLSLEPGGGICQVSTTVFRAAYRAGLPITERHPHSHQVAYYGAPGLDAAVYAPSKNLRWLNDTGGPVLVQLSWNLKRQTLRADLFGRPDGRRVWVARPRSTAAGLPPPPAYVADAGVAPGETRRVDMPAPGSRTTVLRQVRYPGGRVIRRETVSLYRAWGGAFGVHPTDSRLR